MFKKRIIQALWIVAGVVTLVLLGAAMRSKSTKVCTAVEVRIDSDVDKIFVDDKDVLAIVNSKGDVVNAEIQTINLRSLEELLEKNAWVNNAELYFDNNQKLIVNIEEREPVARIFTVDGSSFYIDTTKLHLPLSERQQARVPVFTGFPVASQKLRGADSLLMEDVLTIAKYIMADSFWQSQVAQIDILSDASFEVIPTIGNHTVLLGDAKNLEDKLNRLFTFYKETAYKNGLNKYSVLNVQFNNQVIAVKRGFEKWKSDSVLTSTSLTEVATPALPTNDTVKVQPTVDKKVEAKAKANTKPVTKKENIKKVVIKKSTTEKNGSKQKINKTTKTTH